MYEHFKNFENVLLFPTKLALCSISYFHADEMERRSAITLWRIWYVSVYLALSGFISKLTVLENVICIQFSYHECAGSVIMLNRTVSFRQDLRYYVHQLILTQTGRF
jgi:hypothetical protein